MKVIAGTSCTCKCMCACIGCGARHYITKHASKIAPASTAESSKFKIKLIHTICVQKFLTRRTVYAYPCSILHCTVYKNQRLSIAEWKSHILTISRGPHISTTRSCSSKPALDSFIFRRNSRLYMWLYIQWAETNAHQIQSMNNHNVWTMNNGCM